LQRAMSEQVSVNFEERHPSLGIWLEIHAYPALEGLSVYIRDVTERHRAQEMLQEREVQLLHAQKMEAIGQLAGGIAHDFNNLLTVIIGFGNLVLERTDLPIGAQAQLGEVVKAGERAAALTNQLLAFGRRQNLQPQVLDLNVVLADIEQLLAQLVGAPIDLIKRPASDLGSVQADPGQIEQVIVNLVVNARDAMPDGGQLTIETTNVELDAWLGHVGMAVPAGSYVRLLLRDTGTGMDPETLARIFEPFFTTKEPGKGTGLGLASVYGIVTQSGGHVRVESKPGVGTVFEIYLPRVDATVRSAGRRDATAAVPRGSETVLLVEDEPMVRSLVSAVLHALGYVVLEASGGYQALTLLASHGRPIDLLVTDIVMPQMDGREVARHVTERYPATKVLYLSGYASPAAVEGAHFMQKPFTPLAIAAKVRAVLDSS
ncbi:MAG: hypothetical protein HW416_3000, partial [Chloroflexi bacterium]|nr:hypothetical protein [Chloroflexota bacterium]